MKRSKKYNEAAKKIDQSLTYSPSQAVKLAKETSTTKYDATVEVSMVLGVDPKKADQAVRSTVNLPHGTGKTARVLVFAGGERAEEARAAGADIVGADELIEEVSKGRLDYDAVVSTPELMGKVGRLGKVLGPRGLMPNPKTGTVTTDVAKAVTDIKGERSNSVLIKTQTFTSLSARFHLRPINLQRTTQQRSKKFSALSHLQLRVVTSRRSQFRQRWDLESRSTHLSLATVDQFFNN